MLCFCEKSRVCSPKRAVVYMFFGLFVVLLTPQTVCVCVWAKLWIMTVVQRLFSLCDKSLSMNNSIYIEYCMLLQKFAYFWWDCVSCLLYVERKKENEKKIDSILLSPNHVVQVQITSVDRMNQDAFAIQMLYHDVIKAQWFSSLPSLKIIRATVFQWYIP